jgi:predicted amidohydrolase
VPSINQFAKRHGYPAHYVSDMPDYPQAVVCRGGACILSPFGDLLAGPLWDSEGVLTAEIDLGRFQGPSTTSDIFTLSVNPTARLPVRYGVDAELS